MLFCLLFGLPMYSRQAKCQLSSHMGDNTKGSPATDVLVDLEKTMSNVQWGTVASEKTDFNGRIKK